MTDDEFLCAFERCSLGRRDWTHEAHVRMAWLYLTRIPAGGEVFDRVRNGIKKLNSAFVRRQQMMCAVKSPKPKDPRGLDGYHETITRCFLSGVRHFLADADTRRPLVELVNELLLSPAGRRDWPLRFYSRERLFSVEARREFISPDLSAMP